MNEQSTLLETGNSVLGSIYRSCHRDNSSSSLTGTTSPASKRLLVVEDDATNRIFINDLLISLGFTNILIEHNGLDAVKRLEQESFDLVLMDCQMPVMDGFEATRRIRSMEMERGNRSHVPIIALTAFVLAEERERCLHAGMDSFLPKPVEEGELRNLLASWLALPQGKIKKSTASQLQQNDGPIDKTAFQEMRDNLGQESIEAMIEAFLSTLPEKRAALQSAFAAGDMETLHRVAHTLKGNSGILKATFLSDICKNLVLLSKAGTLQEAPSLLAQLETEADRVTEALKNEEEQV